MKKLLLFVGIFALMSPLTLKAQVTIGANQAPNPSAVLDLQSNGTLGLLLPCVVLTDTLNAAPLAEHVPGMLVYNTSPSVDGQVVRGIYYDDGRRWWLATAGTGDDLGATYVGSPSIVLNSASSDGEHLIGDFERAALTGDVTAEQNSNVLTIAEGAVTSEKILDGSITGADIAPHAISITNLNGDDGTEGQVPTVDADGDVVWQTLAGGGSDYVAFKGQVYTTTATTYTVPDDAYAVMTMAPSAVTITMPVLTEADKGRTIYVMNNNTGGTSNQFDSSIIGTGVNQNMSRGSVFIWFGDKWVSFSK